MGKVTVIIQSEEVSTSELYRQVQEAFEEDTPVGKVHMMPDCDVFIVPDDEEFPDLS